MLSDEQEAAERGGECLVEAMQGLIQGNMCQ